LRLAGWTLVAAVVYASAAATFSALSAFFVLYRRRLAGALLCSFGYVLVLIGGAAAGAINFGAVLWHMWALAAALGAGTVVVAAGAVRARVLGWSHIGVAALAWAVYASIWATLIGDGIARSGPLSVAAPAAVIVALMPLLSFVLAPWSLHQLRHP